MRYLKTIRVRLTIAITGERLKGESPMSEANEVDGVVMCVVCNKPMKDYEPVYCCSGRGCGCLGLPQEPPVCSKECWDKIV